MCKNCKIVIKSRRIYCSITCQQDFQRKILIKDWLETGEVYAASRKGHYVRDFISKDQNNKCAICFIDNIWQEQELVLILDHIDGNASNNRRKNLRLICPNCDSQLPTYKGKNAGKGRFSRRDRYSKGLSY